MVAATTGSIQEHREAATRLSDLFRQRAEALSHLETIDNEIESLQGGGQVKSENRPAPRQSASGEAPRRRGRPPKNAQAQAQSGEQKRGRGRPRKEQSQSQNQENGERKRPQNAMSLKSTIAQALKSNRRTGLTLDQLVQKCHEAGYQSSSDEKGYVQNIRTNLSNLINAGTVSRDDEKRYHLAQEAEEAA